MPAPLPNTLLSRKDLKALQQKTFVQVHSQKFSYFISKHLLPARLQNSQLRRKVKENFSLKVS